MNNHIEAVHVNKRNHKCEKCPYRTSHKVELRRHVKQVHDNIRNHPSVECGYDETKDPSVESDMLPPDFENEVQQSAHANPGSDNGEEIAEETLLELTSDMKFKDWSSFEEHFQKWKYQHLTHTYKQDAKKNREENADTHKYWRVEIRCVHFGQPRLRETKQIRKNQSYMARGCQFRFLVKLDKHRNEYYLDKLHLQHSNHEVSEEAFRQHPHGRRLSNPEIAKYVEDYHMDNA